MTNIKVVYVPNYPELKLKSFYERAYADKRFKDYLPDDPFETFVNKDFLSNVCETAVEGYVSK